MKKILLLIPVSIILLFSFTACKTKSTPVTDVANTMEESNKTAPTKDTTTESFELAQSELDIAKCSTIENKDDRKNCEEIVTVEIMRNAVETKDAELCDKLDDSTKKQECAQNANNL